MTPSHGLSCKAGYSPIQTPRQCLAAAQSLGLAARHTPIKKEFLGETWHLVRYTPESHWHPATDDLAGTEVYGAYPQSQGEIGNNSFSITFGSAYDKMLLSDANFSNFAMIYTPGSQHPCFGTGALTPEIEQTEQLQNAMYSSEFQRNHTHTIYCHTARHRNDQLTDYTSSYCPNLQLRDL